MSLNCAYQRARCSSPRRKVWSSGGMILTGTTEDLREKHVPVPLCPPETPHELYRARPSTNSLSSWHGQSFILLSVYAFQINHHDSSQNICSYCFFYWRWGGSSTQAWMPTYVSILRIPQIWFWRATVELYIDRENPKNLEKTCPITTLSTTNPTWIDPGANPGLRG
jgi:hypothetical protein